MGRNARLYVPISVGFFDDDVVVQAGEKAGWLYLAILARIKAQDADGLISRLAVSRLNVPGWQRRLDTLLAYGMVREVGEGIYEIPGWFKWNESSEERAERRARDRERKRFQVESERIPDGFRPDSALKKARKQGSTPPTTTVITPLSTVGG